jgi:transcriptional regulator with XRE-family HTH domain
MAVSDSDTRKQVRRVLTKALRSATITQAALARAAGITYYAFRQYWYGRRMPPAAVLKRLAKVLQRQGGKLVALGDELEAAARR